MSGEIHELEAFVERQAQDFLVFWYSSISMCTAVANVAKIVPHTSVRIVHYACVPFLISVD